MLNTYMSEARFDGIVRQEWGRESMNPDLCALLDDADKVSLQSATFSSEQIDSKVGDINRRWRELVADGSPLSVTGELFATDVLAGQTLNVEREFAGMTGPARYFQGVPTYHAVGARLQLLGFTTARLPGRDEACVTMLFVPDEDYPEKEPYFAAPTEWIRHVQASVGLAERFGGIVSALERFSLSDPAASFDDLKTTTVLPEAEQREWQSVVARVARELKNPDNSNYYPLELWPALRQLAKNAKGDVAKTELLAATLDQLLRDTLLMVGGQMYDLQQKTMRPATVLGQAMAVITELKDVVQAEALLVLRNDDGDLYYAPMAGIESCKY